MDMNGLVNLSGDQGMLVRLGLALAIGLLIGIERGWRYREQASGHRIAGIRTFALLGLLGGIVGTIGKLAGPPGDAILISAIFIAVAILLGIVYRTFAPRFEDYSVTTEVAALLTLGLGLIAVAGSMEVAAAGAVAAVALLSTRQFLHGWLEHLEGVELDAAIKLLIISVILLPLLPDKGFGPGGILNPYELWWMVVLVAGLSFTGYIAIRIAGPGAGVLLTAAFGGIASSTAVTISLSRMSRQHRVAPGWLAAGVMLASATMALRTAILTALLNINLLDHVIPAAAIQMLILGSGTAIFIYRFRHHPPSSSPPDRKEMSNPLELGMAIKFAVVLGAVLLLAYWVRLWIGDSGLYLVAALSALTDVDAITVSMSRIGAVPELQSIAGGAIVVAMAVNTLVKGAIPLVIGTRDMAVSAIWWMLAAALGCGAVLTLSFIQG